VRHDDRFGALGEDELQGREELLNAVVIRNLEFLIQWNIQISSDQNSLTGNLQIY
jgi:hypothetical protein